MIKYFKNEKGLVIPAVTAEQMIQIDKIALEETGPNLFQMMENAGRSLTLCAIDMFGNNWQKAKIIVLGGNGGGGICAARHLGNRNLDVTLCITDNSKLNDILTHQQNIYRITDGKEIIIDDLKNENPDLIIDAIIGYGLISEPSGRALNMINWANLQNCRILSLDVPSGINSTTGEAIGKHIKADRTLTLALPKTGLLQEFTGELFLADLGIPAKVYKMLGIEYSDPFKNKFLIKLK